MASIPPREAPEGRLGSRKPRVGRPKSDERARPEQVQQLSEPPQAHEPDFSFIGYCCNALIDERAGGEFCWTPAEVSSFHCTNGSQAGWRDQPDRTARRSTRGLVTIGVGCAARWESSWNKGTSAEGIWNGARAPLLDSGRGEVISLFQSGRHVGRRDQPDRTARGEAKRAVPVAWPSDQPGSMARWARRNHLGQKGPSPSPHGAVGKAQSPGAKRSVPIAPRQRFTVCGWIPAAPSVPASAKRGGLPCGAGAPAHPGSPVQPARSPRSLAQRAGDPVSSRGFASS